MVNNSIFKHHSKVTSMKRQLRAEDIGPAMNNVDTTNINKAGVLLPPCSHSCWANASLKITWPLCVAVALEIE